MNVIITGSSSGMGKAAALKFLANGYTVFGLDIAPATIQHENYTHYLCDVSHKDELPNLPPAEILINNAGVQKNARYDIDVNLLGVMYCTEKYGLHPGVRSIINQASVSAHNGAEFPGYVASKGGVLAYTKWTAKEVAKYGATANSISFGGVITELNSHVMDNGPMWDDIMSMTPLKKWATAEEAADWIYFIATVNKSMTAQDIVIDNGEMFNHRFVW